MAPVLSKPQPENHEALLEIQLNSFPVVVGKYRS